MLQLARELRAALPRMLGAHPLRNLWAYKYDPRLAGLLPHIDPAAVNVNLWIADVATPHAAAGGGGLVVYDIAAGARASPALARLAAGWTAGLTPGALADPASPERRALAAECPNVTVAHAPNRLMIFDSSLPHMTQDIRDWPLEYEARRVSLTLLYGESAAGAAGGDLLARAGL